MEDITKDRARIMPLFPRPFENNDFCTRIDRDHISNIGWDKFLTYSSNLDIHFNRILIAFSNIASPHDSTNIYPTDGFNVNDSTKLQRTFPDSVCVCPACVTVYNVRTLLRMETINYSSVVTAPVSPDASRQRSFKCNNRSAPFEPDVNALAYEHS